MALLCYGMCFSQSFNYQAVVRNASGDVVPNQSVGVQLRLLQGSATGTNVYTEIHSATTNTYGVLSLAVGAGTTTDDFSAIDWSTQDYWLETAVDISGGTTYTVIGSSQLLSVPSSNYATTSGDKAFSTTVNVTSNAPGNIATDDFVFGSTQLDNDPTTIDDNNKMFFDKSKGAFRVGSLIDIDPEGDSEDNEPGDEWNDTNVGIGSIAMGEGSIAAGKRSVAMGESNNIDATSPGSMTFGNGNNIVNSNGSYALGDRNDITHGIAMAIGYSNTASAFASIAIGSVTHAGSYGETSMGLNNTRVDGNKESYIATDRLFVIGNGISVIQPRDALVMLKNGNTTLNGQLTIDADNTGAGASYTLPAQDGSVNQVMQTDGAGNVSWVNTPNDADADPTNEIELPVGGSNGQVLQTDGSGNYSWTNNTEAPGAYTAAILNAAAGWEYYNAAFSVTNFQDPRYRVVNNVIYLEGLVRKNAAVSNSDTIMTLPEGYRPQKTRIFSVETENGSMRVDVNPNGTVLIATGFNINQNWVSFDGITFSVD